jgi:hypothetical protein
MAAPATVRLPAVLSALSGSSQRHTKLTHLARTGLQRRPDEPHATALMLHTALARHKPSTQRQYDVGRRLVARWLRAEGLESLSFSSFRLLAWDLEDAGYSGDYLRLVHNATREVLESLGGPSLLLGRRWLPHLLPGPGRCYVPRSR